MVAGDSFRLINARTNDSKRQILSFDRLKAAKRTDLRTRTFSVGNWRTREEGGIEPRKRDLSIIPWNC